MENQNEKLNAEPELELTDEEGKLDMNNVMKLASSLLKNSDITSTLGNLNGGVLSNIGNLNGGLSSNLGLLGGGSSSGLLQGLLPSNSTSTPKAKTEEITKSLNEVMEKLIDLDNKMTAPSSTDLSGLLEEMRSKLQSLENNTVSTQKVNLLFQTLTDVAMKIDDLQLQMDEINEHISKLKKKKK